MSKLVRSLALVALPTALVALSADAGLSKSGDSSVTFHATGSAGMKFDGTTSEMTVADNGKVLRITVPLKNLATGSDLRDKHMKENYLEVGKYPDALFAVLKTNFQMPEAGKSSSGEAEGSFNLHGVTKTRKAKYTAKNDGGTITVTASMPLNMNEHDIVVKPYLGVKVNPDVTLDVSFKVKE